MFNNKIAVLWIPEGSLGLTEWLDEHECRTLSSDVSALQRWQYPVSPQPINNHLVKSDISNYKGPCLLSGVTCNHVTID